MEINEFIKKAKKVHGDKYNYSESVYIGYKKNITIICPLHGEFEQTPDNHLHGHGCQKCGNVHKPTTEEFINKAIKIHGNKYDYSKTQYKSAKKVVIITCPIHGEFKQAPNKHLQGRGCPICKQSHMERDVAKQLSENNIKFIYQYKIYKRKKLSYDFYLPEYNTIIECQGEQHFSSVNFYNKKINSNIDKYNLQKLHDDEKYKDAIDNNINIIYFTNSKYYMNKKIDIKSIEFYKNKTIYYNINNMLNELLNN